MIRYDSHVHTSFSTDSDTPMEEMVLTGIQKHLSGITFTDHMDYHFPLKYPLTFGYPNVILITVRGARL